MQTLTISHTFILFIINFIVNKHKVAGSSLVECQLDSDCPLAPYQICKVSFDAQSPNGICQHKKAFPMHLQQIIGTALVALGLSLCNAGGVGGGAILVPLFVLFSRFTQGQAIALAYFIILIGGIIRFIRNYKQKDPRAAHRVAIDYNIATILMPMTLFGTTIGVFINTTFPEPVLVIMMVVVFLAASGQTMKKGVARCKKEKLERWKNQIAVEEALMVQEQNEGYEDKNRVKEQRKEDAKYFKQNNSRRENQIRIRSLDQNLQLNLQNLEYPSPSTGKIQQDQQQSLYLEDYEEAHDAQKPNFIKQNNLPADEKNNDGKRQRSVSAYSQQKNVLSISDHSTKQGSKKQIMSEALSSIHKMQGSHCVWYKLFLICSVLISLTIISILRKSGMVESCSATDWILQGLLLIISILTTVFASIVAVCEDRRKARSEYKFNSQDFRFSSCRRVLGLSLAALFGTAIATAIGSGGGTIYSPLLLSIGLSPEVTSATAMYLIMFKSLATVIQFSVIGQIDWEYSIWFGVFALIAVVFLSSKIEVCFKGKQSVLVVLLGFIIMAGAFLMPVILVPRILNGDNDGIFDDKLWQMADICDSQQ